MKLTVLIAAASLISIAGFSQTNSSIAFKAPSNNFSAQNQEVIANHASALVTANSLVNFVAVPAETKIDLNWITSFEKNVSHFQVEKSTDGINYTAACVVFAYGNTTENKTYSFADKIKNNSKETIYYRLRLIENDGKSQLSETIRINSANEVIPMLNTPAQATSIKSAVTSA